MNSSLCHAAPRQRLLREISGDFSQRQPTESAVEPQFTILLDARIARQFRAAVTGG